MIRSPGNLRGNCSAADVPLRRASRHPVRQCAERSDRTVAELPPHRWRRARDSQGSINFFRYGWAHKFIRLERDWGGKSSGPKIWKGNLVFVSTAQVSKGICEEWRNCHGVARYARRKRKAVKPARMPPA